MGSVEGFEFGSGAWVCVCACVCLGLCLLLVALGSSGVQGVGVFRASPEAPYTHVVYTLALM